MIERLQQLVEAQARMPALSNAELKIEDDSRRGTVSAAIVARDEAATIGYTLASIRPHVDEIVVLVDHRTEDETFEVASKLADVVDYFTWDDGGFASARNRAIERCSSDWVMIVDAHEVLHPQSPQIMKALLYRTEPGGDLQDTEVFKAVAWMDPEYPSDGDIRRLVPKTMFLQPRLFRNNGRHRYVGAAHNWLKTDDPGSTGQMPVGEFIFVHHRTPENSRRRREQRATDNVRALLADVEREPESARAYFYLAQTYYEMKDYGRALLWYRRYVKRSTWPAERAHAKFAIGSLWADAGKRWTRAAGWMFDAISDDWQRPEFYLSIGDIAFQHQNWSAARHWYKAATDMQVPMNGMFLTGAAYSYLPYQKLALTYAAVGEWTDAILNAEKAIQLGYENEQFIAQLGVWRERAKIDPRKPNIVFYDETGQFTFLQDLMRRLADHANVATGQGFDPDHVQWSKFVWVEWADKNAVHVSNNPKPEGQRLIVRLHGYEVYRPHSIAGIHWPRVDALVFGASYVRDHFLDVHGDRMMGETKVRLIPYGVNVGRWSFAKRERNKKKKTIAVVGILTEKKGPQLLGMVIQQFARKHPEYRFLLRLDVPGAPNPNMSEVPLRYQIEGLDNWEWVPRQPSMNRWLEEAKFLLSTSTLESFSYVVAEAMCKGIKPLIYDWRGARQLWPEECIWQDFGELEKVFAGEYRSDRYRQWVEDRYPLERQVEGVTKLLEELG